MNHCLLVLVFAVFGNSIIYRVGLAEMKMQGVAGIGDALSLMF